MLRRKLIIALTLITLLLGAAGVSATPAKACTPICPPVGSPPPPDGCC